MNINTKSIFTMLAVAAVFVISSCGKKAIKQAASETPPTGEVEVKILCSGTEFFSDDKTFRANSVGESGDHIISKKKAMNNAMGNLASSINTTIKSVIDNYVSSREVNNVEEFSEKFEGLTRQVVDQEISGIKTICERTTRTPDGKYKTYLAIEMKSEALVESINERLSKEEQLKVDYDYLKFKESFEKEMSKMN